MCKRERETERARERKRDREEDKERERERERVYLSEFPGMPIMRVFSIIFALQLKAF